LSTETALSRSELSKAELQLDLNKLRSEASGLRDALLKLQALNNGLGQDKAELNAMIIQVCNMDGHMFCSFHFM